jgi:hypothetical protein
MVYVEFVVPVRIRRALAATSTFAKGRASGREKLVRERGAGSGERGAGSGERGAGISYPNFLKF